MADQLWFMTRIREEEDYSDSILCCVVGFMQIFEVLFIVLRDLYLSFLLKLYTADEFLEYRLCVQADTISVPAGHLSVLTGC